MQVQTWLDGVSVALKELSKELRQNGLGEAAFLLEMAATSIQDSEVQDAALNACTREV